MKYKTKERICIALAAVIWIAMCFGFWFTLEATEKARSKEDKKTSVTEERVPVKEEAFDTETEHNYESNVPLTYAEQRELREASEEFGIDYYLMLGLIERETNFRNIYGDGGQAYGYCQVWVKWWQGKMQEIGAEDLNVPKDNFRVACAIVRELTDRYGSYEGALTAYNKGSFDGVVSHYATTVMENAEKWRRA